MLLVLDVGNSNIVMAVYGSQDELRKTWRFTTDKAKTVDEYRLLLKGFLAEIRAKFSDLKDIVISSVVPPLNSVLERLFLQACKLKPLFIDCGVKTGLKLKVDNPRGLGADRIVSAVAAFERFGGPVIVMDLGTATTVSVVSGRGEFLGGVICPGMGISAAALSENTAKLPWTDIIPPTRAIGKNTVDSMHAGIYFGYVGLVEGLIKRFKRELGNDVPVIATGGFSALIGSGTKLIERVEPNLILEGLKILHKKNFPR
ncbi:MAG TPA: type III pantothenate kinase [Desulfobacteria bacterium]|nr:type III pantothenate kinase [Desulfobacteria bacterium]